MPPRDRRHAPRGRKLARFLPVDRDERQTEIAREEAAIIRQFRTWGLNIQPPADAGRSENES